MAGIHGGLVTFLSTLLLFLFCLHHSAHANTGIKAFFQGSCGIQNLCDHLCNNQSTGGYICLCQDGFTLNDNGYGCDEIPKEEQPGLSPELENELKELDGEHLPVMEDDPEDLDEELDEEAEEEEEEITDPEEEEEDDEEDEDGDAEAEGKEATNAWVNMLAAEAKDEESDEDEEIEGDGEEVGENTFVGEEKPIELHKNGLSSYSRAENAGKTKEGGHSRWSIKPGKMKSTFKTKQKSKSKFKFGKNRKGKQKGKHRGKNRYKPGKSRKKPQKPVMSHITDEPQKDKAIVRNNEVLQSSSPASSRTQSCTQLRCRANGRCFYDKIRKVHRCRCPLGTTGEFCQNDIVVKYPQFMGEGYISFPVLRGAGRVIKVSIEFRPDTSNGLLLFSSLYNNARSDFFSISLVHGHAEFRFDCGTGPAIVRTKNKVNLQAWNTIYVFRNGRDGMIRLNNGTAAKGMSEGLFERITLRKDLFLGGYNDIKIIGARTGMEWGFVGCVRMLKVNDRMYDMRKGLYVGDAINGADVTECSASVCDGVQCLNSGTCKADTPDTHLCLCPLGTGGDHCEKKIDVFVPKFNGNSYLRYEGLHRTALSYTEMEFIFKPSQPNGLIFYNGYNSERSGDFISLAMVYGYVEYRFDLGTGPAILKSRNPLTLNEWHQVKLTRTARQGEMTVDSEPVVKGFSKGAFTQLTLTMDMFVGGHRNFDEVSRYAGIGESFRGCVQKVMIKGKELDLVREAKGGVNIENCDHTCVGQPCKNGGRCIPMYSTYQCACPLGYTNTDCEDRLVKRAIREPLNVPMFRGHSYLMYIEPRIINRVKGEKIDIQMRFKALGSNGLLFWASEENMTSTSDYISLGLVKGHLQFAYNLGDGEIVIRYNRSRLDDNTWHWIRAQRNHRLGYLMVDQTEVVEGTAPGKLGQLNVFPKLYIGGTNDNHHKTLDKYPTGLVGCISNLTLATDYHVDLINEADRGQNIRECV